MDAKEKALRVTGLLGAKKAGDVVVLDMAGITSVADYFVIATGNTTRQTRALLEYLEEEMREHQAPVRRVEGARGGEWILVDLDDVIVHLFTPEQRAYYRLESLWKEAGRLQWPTTGE